METLHLSFSLLQETSEVILELIYVMFLNQQFLELYLEVS